MTRTDEELTGACHRLAKAAEAFVNRAPKVTRLQAERSALLDAIAHAQLLLSVRQLPKDSGRASNAPSSHSTALLEGQLKQSKAALTQLERRLRPLAAELETLESSVDKAKSLLDSALSGSKVPDTETEAA